MPDVADDKDFPMCVVDMTEFTLVCFWTQLRQVPIRQNYHSLGSLYNFFFLLCSVLSEKNEYDFPLLFALECP
jgi:hypothetical protein